jgi:hypothetical protein
LDRDPDDRPFERAACGALKWSKHEPDRMEQPMALPKNVPHGLIGRGEEARLLITLEPAGVEYFLVLRDDTDADPGKFGLVVHETASAM